MEPKVAMGGFRAICSRIFRRGDRRQCNRYLQRGWASDIATAYGAEVNPSVEACLSLLYPGARALIVQRASGQRHVTAQLWGTFSETDAALDGNDQDCESCFFSLDDSEWAHFVSMPEQRCLIPIERFSRSYNRGSKKKPVWFSVLGQSTFAWAGVCKSNDDGIQMFAGLMTHANAVVARHQSYMPVIVREQDWDLWLEGDVDDLRRLQRPYNGPMTVSLGAPGQIIGPRQSFAPTATENSAREAIVDQPAHAGKFKAKSDMAKVPIGKDQERAVKALKRFSARASRRLK